jgi:hypothetical protein
MFAVTFYYDVSGLALSHVPDLSPGTNTPKDVESVAGRLCPYDPSWSGVDTVPE